MAESGEKNLSCTTSPVRKRHTVWSLFLLIPLLLLIAAAGLFLGKPHRWQVDTAVSRQEAERLQNIIRKMTSSMVTDEGKMAESAVIELSPAEINTLLTAGLRAAQLRQSPGFYYDAEWVQGALLLRGCKILPVLAVNLEAEIIPAVRSGIVSISVRSCRIGRLPLNPKVVEYALRENMKKYEHRQEFRIFTAIVESLTVQNSSIILRIRPEKINLIFPLLLNATMEGC